MDQTMRETILLEENNDTLRKITGSLLTADGYCVIEARTPEEAEREQHG